MKWEMAYAIALPLGGILVWWGFDWINNPEYLATYPQTYISIFSKVCLVTGIIIIVSLVIAPFIAYYRANKASKSRN